MEYFNGLTLFLLGFSLWIRYCLQRYSKKHVFESGLTTVCEEELTHGAR